MTIENKPASTNPSAPSTATQGKAAEPAKASEPAKTAEANTQSTKSVAPATPVVKTDAGNEPPKNTINDNAAADHQKSLDHATTAGDAAPVDDPAAGDAAPVDDPAAELSADEEKHLERILDGEDDDAPASLSDRTPEDFKDVATKLKRLILAVPETSPDSHTVWGAGGVVLTLGDLRVLVKYMN